jgi:hypothetical protein
LPRPGEVPWLRVADDLQLDTGRCKAGDPGVEEALEAFALGQPVEASDDDRASRRFGSDGTMRNPRTIVARRQESDLARLGGRCERLAVLGGVGGDEVGLRRRFPQVTIVGPVADVRPYMASARIGLVPDLLGGFKLKGLDYVFNRLPIMAMRASLPGMPLEDGVSFGLFDTHVGLAEGVLSLIDSFAELNARQEQAFAACADGFDWPSAHVRY